MGEKFEQLENALSRIARLEIQLSGAVDLGLQTQAKLVKAEAKYNHLQEFAHTTVETVRLLEDKIKRVSELKPSRMSGFEMLHGRGYANNHQYISYDKLKAVLILTEGVKDGKI